MRSIYLVRHGSYDYHTQHLNHHGKTIDAPHAAEVLRERGVGSDAIIMSSVLDRALETAGIIGEGLGIQNVYRSVRIAKGGNNVRTIRNLDEFLGKALVECGLDVQSEQPLVVVTHAPMVAAAKGHFDSGASERIGFGEVYPYEPHSWQNPGFSPGAESLLEIEMK